MAAMIALERLYTVDVVVESVSDSGEVTRKTSRETTPFRQIVSRLNTTSADIIKDIVWAGLIEEEPDITTKDVEKIVNVDFKDLAYIIEQVDKAVCESGGIDREQLLIEREEALRKQEEGVNPEKNLSGAGKKSKSSAADSSD